MLELRLNPEPWRIVVGPIGAALSYAKALKWKCHSITSWEAEGVNFDLTDRAQLQALSYLMGRAVDRWRWQAIQQAEEASSLGGGIDWQAPRRALKQTKGLEHTALQAIWQGAIRHGKGAVCRRCDKPASLKHVLWDCSWWRTHCQEPEDFPRLRQENPDASLWLRGLPGKVMRPASYEFGIQETGVFEQPVVSDPDLRYATDGSPGASQDPRFQALTWGVIAFRVDGSDLVICGKATGPVPRQQTVFRAEAQALAYLVDKTETDLDVTLDCQGVQTNVNKAGPLWKAEDIFGRIRPHKDRLDIHWVNSHLDLPNFVKKFGAADMWRWKANQEVDFLVQTRANEVRDLQWEAVMLKRDAVTCKVNKFLATRGAELLRYNDTEGPLIEFGTGPNRPTQPSPGVPRQPSKRVKQSAFNKRQSKPQKPRGDRNQDTARTTPNKRRLLEEAVDNQCLGHQFSWTSRHQNGARIKCLLCGLGAAQINKLELLQRVLAQPCKGHDLPSTLRNFGMRTRHMSCLWMACTGDVTGARHHSTQGSGKSPRGSLKSARVLSPRGHRLRRNKPLAMVRALMMPLPRTSRGEGELPERDHQTPKAPSIQSFFLKKVPQPEHVQDAGGVPRPGVQAKASGANRKQGQAGRQTKLIFGSTVR